MLVISGLSCEPVPGFEFSQNCLMGSCLAGAVACLYLTRCTGVLRTQMLRQQHLHHNHYNGHLHLRTTSLKSCVAHTLTERELHWNFKAAMTPHTLTADAAADACSSTAGYLLLYSQALSFGARFRTSVLQHKHASHLDVTAAAITLRLL